MYKTILITLEATKTDRAIIEHVKKLAKVMKSTVMLLHVATGVPAQFNGPDAAGEEVSAEFIAEGIPAHTTLAYGEPVTEIIKWVQHNDCDLVAMSTHGHRFVADVLLGATASKVQHSIDVPVLLIRTR
jgi:nucleotide-binding universal stress UspA family protein